MFIVFLFGLFSFLLCLIGLKGLDFLIPLFFSISCFFTVNLSNPVYCIVSLIFAYLFGSLFAISFGFSYLGLVYIIVYVGALTVLFLFVVMMLNLTAIEILGLKFSLFGFFSRFKDFSLIYFFLFGFFIFIFFFDNYLYFFYYLFDLFIVDVFLVQGTFFSFDLFFLSNDFISNLGFVLYTKHFLSFTIAALLLLISMIGAIVLTYTEKQRYLHSQSAFLQLSRDYRKCIYICEL